MAHAMIEEDEFIFPHECSWCGGDLRDLMKAERISFDSALEAHVPECESWLREQGMGHPH